MGSWCCPALCCRAAIFATTIFFPYSQWEAVTEAAKGMITHMLADEAERSSAAELLQVNSGR